MATSLLFECIARSTVCSIMYLMRHHATYHLVPISSSSQTVCALGVHNHGYRYPGGIEVSYASLSFSLLKQNEDKSKKRC